MAELYVTQAAEYAQVRPAYPKEWFSKLASLTPHHALAWDAGTGSGQAALQVAEHYDRVIATDVSEAQLHHAAPHPRVRYLHTPPSASDDELVAALGGLGRQRPFEEGCSEPLDLVCIDQSEFSDAQFKLVNLVRVRDGL